MNVWQDKTVIEIVESVFAGHPMAAWTWSEEVSSFMKDTRPRSYCIQYRETDYAFIQRLLTEEGLSFRIAEKDTAPALHQLMLFADTTQENATPEDATSKSAAGGPGIRYHGARSREQQDSIQGWGVKLRLTASLTTLLTHDYKTKQAIAASVPAE
jgi:type VI secretion system secreted protein VgrG